MKMSEMVSDESHDGEIGNKLQRYNSFETK
jgi:hypothetical protein